MAETVQIQSPHGPLRATLLMPEKKPDTGRGPAVLIGPRMPGDLLEIGRLEQELTESLRQADFAVLICEGRDGAVHNAAQLVDEASAAFRWLLLRDGIDPDRVGLFGAGLSSITIAGLAARSDRIARICLFSPVTAADVATRALKPDGRASFIDSSAVAEEFVSSLTELSPVEDLAAEDRPTLILHGAADRTVPPESSYTYVDALDRAGRQITCELIAHADHDLESNELRGAGVSRIVGFFRAMARARRKSAQLA